MENKVITFGIIGAMESEITKLVSDFENAETTVIRGLTFYSGMFGGHKVVVVRSGIGKVNAARCTQLLVDAFSPDYIINSGIAGGIGDGLSIGDIIIGSELVQHDFDVTAFGHVRGFMCIDGEDDTKPTVFRSDEKLVAAAFEAANSLNSGRNVREGRIATGDCFVHGPSMKHIIAGEMKAEAAEMEGCAIAQVAEANGVPFLVVRSLSDLADGTSTEDYPAFEKATADLSARFVETLVKCFKS